MQSRSSISLTIALICASTLASAQGILNTSYKSRTGERVLRYEMILPAPKEDVWKSFTTCSGICSWLAPIAAVDLRIGGYISTQFEHKMRIGDPGTVSTRILNYIDGEMLTMEVDLNDYFSRLLRGEEIDLQEIIQFVSLGENQTKLVSSIVGWGDGPKWDEAYDFYARGSAVTYQQLLDSYKKDMPAQSAPASNRRFPFKTTAKR